MLTMIPVESSVGSKAQSLDVECQHASTLGGRYV